MKEWDTALGIVLMIAILATIVGATVWAAVWNVRAKANCMEACTPAHPELINLACYCSTLDGYERPKEGE